MSFPNLGDSQVIARAKSGSEISKCSPFSPYDLAFTISSPTGNENLLRVIRYSFEIWTNPEKCVCSGVRLISTAAEFCMS